MYISGITPRYPFDFTPIAWIEHGREALLSIDSIGQYPLISNQSTYLNHLLDSLIEQHR